LDQDLHPTMPTVITATEQVDVTYMLRYDIKYLRHVQRFSYLKMFARCYHINPMLQMSVRENDVLQLVYALGSDDSGNMSGHLTFVLGAKFTDSDDIKRPRDSQVF